MTPNNEKLCYYQANRGGLLRRIVRRLTRWAWSYQMRATVDYLHERGLINSHTLHEAHAFTTGLLEPKKPTAP